MAPTGSRLGRLARVALAWGAAALVLAAFARVLWRELLAEDAEGDVELVVMHWAGDAGAEEDAIVVDALERYRAAHPNVVVKRINPGDAASYYTKLQTMLAAGEPPDVFYVGPERVPAFASMGLLFPVDELVAEGGVDLGAMYPAVVDGYRWDGERLGSGALYGVPKDFTTIGFYYNVDLFERAGVPLPADDWTWDDFIDAARRIGELDGCTGAEFVTWAMMIRLYLWTEGGDVCGDDFDVLTLREETTLAALERLRAWRHDEEDALTSGKSKIATGATVFLTGKVGLAGPFGRWVVPSYRKIEDFRWDFAPLPRGTLTPGIEPKNAIASVAWCISSRTAHPREAWELVAALTSPDAQDRAARLGLAIPPTRTVAESDAFVDPTRPPLRDRVYLDQAAHARVIPWPANPKFESLFVTRMEQALKTGDATVEEAIADFETAWATEGASPLARADFPPMPWAGIATGIGLALLVLVALGGAWWWRTRPGPMAFAEERAGWALVSPLVLGLVLFTAFPVGLSFLLSFARWNGTSSVWQADWVGLANYEQLLGVDERFRLSLRQTAYYALLAVPVGQLLALVAALLMNTRVRGIGFFRGAWYLPSVLAGVGVAVLWRWVFDGDSGLLNAALEPALGVVGLEPPEWFGEDAEWWGPPGFALLSAWMVGGSMMIYLAGLKGIPTELYEAAEMDGAGAAARFFRVTLPMLSPTILFNGIMAIIASFQVFTQAFVMTGGEPGDLTRFYVLYLYNQAFEFYEMGYASAMAWLLLVVVLVLTLVVMRGSRRHVHYEALST